MAPYIARQFVASSPAAEVLGVALLSFTQNLLAEDMRPLLQKHQLGNPVPDQWYS